MSNLERAAEIIHQHPQYCNDAAAHPNADGLLAPKWIGTQCETVGEDWPENEDMPDFPKGTVVCRKVGEWEVW